MNGRKLVLGALTAFAVAFLLAGLWHVLLMSDFYDTAQGGTMRDPSVVLVDWPWLLGRRLHHAYMYPKGYEGALRSVKG